MDLSGLIFVALAVAWAVYLIPKALKHHDDVVRSRSVDRFSHTMRVLARREPVNRRNARLVVTPGRAAVGRRGHRQADRSSRRPPRSCVPGARRPPTGPTRRRRRVLGVLLLANVVVVALAVLAVVGWAGRPSPPVCSSPGWSPAG